MDRKIEKKTWTPKRILTFGGGGLLFVFIFYLLVFADTSSKLNVESERLTISEVKHGPFQEFIPITGTVQPIETFYLDVSEGGRVVEKYVEEGAFLNEGDPIIRLDNAQLSLDVIYNQANVFSQINNLRSTRLSMEQNRLNLQAQLLDVEYDLLDKKRIYDNNKILFEKNLISKIEFDRSKETYDYTREKRNLTVETYRQDSLFRSQQVSQLEQSVETLQENLSVTKTQLENLTVRAPIKGQLTALNAEIGQSIARGENLGRIDVIDSNKVRASIDEHYIARVLPGQKGEFTFAGNTYELIIKTVFPQVTNGRFEVDMHFAGKIPNGVRRGQTLQIKLELGELGEAVTVDRGGFYQTTGGQWIFVIDESGNYATRRSIKLGRQNTNAFEVIEGLNPGEKVITSSYDNFGDVEKIVLKN
ncbi:MAG TPA: HlyD family efflux transporter periplasmic adaptor subunit [Ignavibacteriaceae bacterium]|nr:HlyD family efflux transporter periplasmic adaptor subunit [Ignavibacteriaceae bacterium]